MNKNEKNIIRKIGIILILVLYMQLGYSINHYCHNCTNCSTTIQNAAYNDIVYLTQNITGVTSDCVEFNGADGITFNCQNYYLNSTSGGDGINLNANSNNNTIQNCKINNFNNGVYLIDNKNNTILSNTITSSGMGGIYMTTSTNNTIISNTITSASFYGMYFLSNSDNNIVTSNIVKFSTYGYYFEWGSHNTLSSNTAIGNSYGLCLRFDSHNNTVTNTLFQDNVWSIRFRSGGTTPNNTFSGNHIGNISRITGDYNFSLYNNNFSSNYYTTSPPYCYSTATFSFCDSNGQSEPIVSTTSTNNIFPFANKETIIYPALITIIIYLIFS